MLASVLSQNVMDVVNSNAIASEAETHLLTENCKVKKGFHSKEEDLFSVR